jgi:hypothetical protein
MAEFVPLSEVIESPGSVEHLVWNLGVPSGVDSEAIRIHVDRFQRGRKLAGIGDVIIEGAKHDQEIDIQGSVNADGSLASAKAKSAQRQAPELRAQSRGALYSSMDIDALPDMHVGVDNNHILRTLGNSRHSTFADHYAHTVSKAMHEALLDGSIKSNVTNILGEAVDIMRIPILPARILGGIVTGIVGWRTYDTVDQLVETAIDFSADNLQELANSALWGNALAYLFHRLRPNIDREAFSSTDLKWSLFNWAGLKMDRLALSAVNRALAKPIVVS